MVEMASSMTSSRLVKEFSELVEGEGERVFVAEHPIDLRRLDRQNDVYVVELSRKASSGGAPPSPSKAYQFKCGTGALVKVAEYDDREDLESLDLPSSSSLVHVVLEDGRDAVVRGVVDKQLTFSFHEYLVH
ncbi:MAG: hypothetical protein JRN58_00995 [Nitrososphaerota archaeon]|nr:hypothetical protein [Nitrososphaerota archaeon]MDG6966205.1 hypothetical protein [Nitrososphaerota archaeon]MDG6977640.1 hypothetical protein [Nitrososphaerota archaeon]